MYITYLIVINSKNFYINIMHCSATDGANANLSPNKYLGTFVIDQGMYHATRFIKLNEWSKLCLKNGETETPILKWL